MVGDQKTTFPYLETPSADESEASLSPDARWLAYTTNESGTNQIVVQSFPKPGPGMWHVSTSGGSYPRWRRDGRELDHCDPSGMIIAVAVSTDRGFKIEKSTDLFKITLSYQFKAAQGGPGFPYDVTADGQRFLVGTPYKGSDQPMTVVLNWPAALKRPPQ